MPGGTSAELFPCEAPAGWKELGHNLLSSRGRAGSVLLLASWPPCQLYLLIACTKATSRAAALPFQEPCSHGTPEHCQGEVHSPGNTAPRGPAPLWGLHGMP